MADKEETVRLQHMNDGNRSNNQSPGDDYDPHLHRNVEHPTTNWETLAHLLKCALGTGILAMPQAFSKAGFLNGIISTILIGMLITHCLEMLVRQQYILCKKKHVALLTYPESVSAAFEIGPKCLRGFSKSAAYITDFFLCIYQLGVCCVYTLFIAETLRKALDPYVTDNLSVTSYMFIIVGPLMIANCIKNLKALAPFSSLANLCILIGLIIVVYFLLSSPPKKSEMVYVGEITQYPLFFGTTLFALTAVGVVVAIENNMQTPKDFGKPLGVLNIGMGIVVALYTALGSIGYLYCFSDCPDSITLDLYGWESTTVQILYAIAILISYVLQCYVPVEILWKTYLKPKLVAKESRRLLFWEYVLRLGLCIATFILALVVPMLGLFISLFGALCLSVLGLIVPAFMEICNCMPNNFGAFKYLLIKDIIIMVIGFCAMISGTVLSIQQIIINLMN